MTPKEGLSIAWAQAQMQKAMLEGKSDVDVYKRQNRDDY